MNKICNQMKQIKQALTAYASDMTKESFMAVHKGAYEIFDLGIPTEMKEDDELDGVTHMCRILEHENFKLEFSWVQVYDDPRHHEEKIKLSHKGKEVGTLPSYMPQTKEDLVSIGALIEGFSHFDEKLIQGRNNK